MKSMFRKLTLSTMAVVLSFGLFGATAGAQDLDDVIIAGRVTDQTGASIVGATVTAILVETDVERSVTTDANGRYRLIELTPGKYSVRVVADGFGRETKTDLDTISGQSVKLDFSLVPESVRAEQTVSVDDTNAPVIDPTRTVVGGSVTGREIEELPNTSNDVLDLVYTLGGTAEEPFSIRNLTDDDRIGGGNEGDQPREVLGAGIVSLSGGAAYSTNITIDGMDNNDDRAAEERFQPPPDSVAEVQIISNQFSAEYGRASGGRINIRTRAGSKRFRGRFFMFFEDESLNANTYNNNRRGLSRLPFTELNPGGTVSGPIPFWYFKDKTFFFSSYSYQDRDATTLIDSALPVDQNPLYPLPSPTDPGDARVDDVPNPNFDTFPEVDIAPYVAQVSTPTRRHRFTQRIDHNFTDTHNLTFSYQLGRSLNFRQYRETTRFLEETLQGRIRDNDSFYVTDNYVFNSNFVNQFRFQYSHYRPDFATQATNDPVVLLFVSDDSRFGRTDQVRGTVVIGNSTANFATLREETRYQFQDTANYIVGNQTFRFGFDVQRIISDNTDLRDSTGTFNFWRVYDFLVNQPSRYRRNFGAESIQKNTYMGFFVQDDWRVTNNLTLSLGLRYERETLVDDNNNFGPRVALAYSPGDEGKSVFRIGAGVFYNRVLLRTLDDYTLGAETVRYDSENLNGPSNESRCLNQVNPGSNANSDKCRFLAALGPLFPNPPTLEELRALEASLGLSSSGFTTRSNFTRQIEPGIKIPESYQFNVGYERDLGRGFAFETNFTYNKAVRLWRETNINAFRLPDGFDTYTDFLLALGTVDVRGVMTRFVLGDPSDPNGVSVDNGVRVVNLRTLNSSESSSAPIGIAFDALEADPRTSKPNPALGQLEQVGDIGQSVYEGLSFELRRRFRPIGFGFRSSMRFVYVLSRSRDDGFVDTSSAQIAGDFKNEFGPSSIDRRHKFRFSGTTEFPSWLGKLRMSPILRIESARPFNVSIGGQDRNLDDVGNDRPNYSGDLDAIRSRHPNSPFPQALADSFSLAPIGSPGNLPRNAGRGPALFIFDVNFSRDFRFNERFRVRPQISFDNILNARVFSFGSDFINLSQAGTDEFAQGFLVPTRTLRQRKIQLGIRIDF